MLGVMQAAHIIRREKPDLIFCKGGFVSVPVAVAGQMLHRPVVLHEQKGVCLVHPRSYSQPEESERLSPKTCRLGSP